MQFPYQRSRRPDGVARLFGRVQAVFSLCVYKGKLESSRTLKSIRMCCHDVRTNATLNCSNLIDIDGSSDGIATSFGWMLLTNERSDGNKESDFSELKFAQNLH